MKWMISLWMCGVLAGCGGGGGGTAATPSAGDPNVIADSAALGSVAPTPGVAGSEAPATDPAAILEQIQAQQSGIRGALAASELTPIHDLADRLGTLTDALIQHSALEGEAAQKLKSASWEVKATAGLLHEAADRGDLGGARQQFVTLDAQIDALTAAAAARP